MSLVHGLGRGLTCGLTRGLTVGAGFAGPLDGLGISPVFAIAPRRLTADYESALCRLRESGGSTELDIGYDANGDLDTAAAVTHIGANSGFFARAYTNVGAVNALQSSAAAQPSYLTTGLGSKPTMDFDGTNHFMNAASLGTTMGGFFCVWQPDVTVNAALSAQALLGVETASRGVGLGAFNLSLNNEIVSVVTNNGAVGWAHASDSVAADVPHTLCILWTGSAYAIRVDGEDKALSTSGTPEKMSLANTIRIGQFNSSVPRRFNGKISELMLFSDNLTVADAIVLEANAANYYGVTLV